jgi:N-acetylglutamate synthase-like GNAT family acetyltransferase
VQARVKKIRRQHEAGAIVVEQTRDFARGAAMLEAADRSTAGLEHPGVCTMIAYTGDSPAGVVAVEAVIDVAVMRSLLVAEPSRGRGIGAALVAAARAAAHTRGARKLYAFAPEAEGRYLEGLGFVSAAASEALGALAGTFVADYLRANPEELARCAAWLLDISMDGIVIR